MVRYIEPGLQVRYALEVVRSTAMSRETSGLVLVFTLVLAFGGTVMWAQDRAIKSCEAKGPTRCSVAAIRGW